MRITGSAFIRPLFGNVYWARSVFIGARLQPKLLPRRVCYVSVEPHMSFGHVVRAHMLIYSSPAMMLAFEIGQNHILSLFMFHGAQLEDFPQHPVFYVNDFFFSSQVKFLRSIGFSDWNPDSSFNGFLQGAAGVGDIAELLFGLEEVELDPNDPFFPALCAPGLDVFMASLLVESGAEVNFRETYGNSPLDICIRDGNRELMHWLLSHHANIIPSGYESPGVWQTVWKSAVQFNENRDRVTVNFIQLEGVLSHLLWHNSDPHATFQPVEVWDRSYEEYYLSLPVPGHKRLLGHAHISTES